MCMAMQSTLSRKPSEDRFRGKRTGKIVFLLVCGVPLALIALFLMTSFNYGSLGFGIFVVVYIWLAFVFLKLYNDGKEFDVLGPAPVLFLLIFLYASASALFVESNGARTDFGYEVSAYVRFMFYLSCILGLMGLGWGMLWIRSGRNPIVRDIVTSRFRIDPNKMLIKLVTLTFLIVVIMYPFYSSQFDLSAVRSYADRALLSRIERAATLTGGMERYFLVDVPIQLILFTCTILLFRKGNILVKVVAVAVMALYVIIQTLSGWRGQVVGAVVIPLLVYHYGVRKIRVPVAVTGAILVFFFMSMLSLARVTSDPKEMYHLIENEIINNDAKYFKFAASGELIVGNNLMRLIGGLEAGETKYNYGRSVITDLLVFLPRYVFPDRPLALSEKYVSTFYPEVFRSGGGLGLFILQEGYWALGLFGVVISMFLFGALVEVVYECFLNNNRNHFVILFYSGFFFALVVTAVRGGIVGSLKAALMNSLPFFLVMLVPVGKLIGGRVVSVVPKIQETHRGK